MFSDPEQNILQLGLMPGMSVADIGAGSGFYSLAAAKAIGDKGKVYAIDVQKDLLSRLKKEAGRLRIHNIEVLWGNAEKPQGIPLRDNSVEAAIIANLLFLTPDRETLINETRRILRPNGRLLFIEWVDSMGENGIGPRPEYIISPEKAKTLFEQLGFVFERRMGAGAHHYGIIFSKK